MFIVEDGSIVANANSYTTVEFASNYFASKGIVSWDSLTQDQKEACLVIATQYVDVKYNKQFKGKLISEDQSLMFPRTYFTKVVNNERSYCIPTVLQQAICEYAICVDLTTMSLTQTFVASGVGELKRKKEEVGAIKTEYEYFQGSTNDNREYYNHYVLADGLITSLLKDYSYRCIRN